MRDLAGGAIAGKWRLGRIRVADPLFPIRLGRTIREVEHPGLEVAGTDAIDPDAIRSPVESEDLGHHHHRRLADRVGADRALSDQAGIGADQHDRSRSPGAAHRLDGGLGREEAAADIRLPDPGPVLLVRVRKRAEDPDARAGDQDVERPEPLFRQPDRGRDCLLRPGVGLGEGDWSQPGKARRDFLSALRIAAGHHHRGSFLEQGSGGSRAQTRRAPGHQRGSSREAPRSGHAAAQLTRQWWSWWQASGGGTSRAGLWSKKPSGRSAKPTRTTGITGQSSGRTTC